MDSMTVREKHKKYLFPAVINYYKEPIVIANGSGVKVIDLAGKSYLDFFGGILTISVGHCHPKINQAVIEQMGKLQHCSTLYQTEPIVNLAETLARITPGKLCKTFFTNSGTEADETAVALARLYTQNYEIIALRHGYSGRSMLAMSLTGHAPWRSLPSPVPGIIHAHAPYCYRCGFGLTYPQCNLRCAYDLEELIQTETCGRVAGILIEPIMGVGGFIVPPPDYLKVAVEIVRSHGGVYICDEVQTGFGRTGKYMFGVEHFGVEPEIMTMAKGIANGFPMGATIATDDVASAWKSLTISTFGGNPISCTAAIATIKVIEDENIPQRAYKLGEILKNGLYKIMEKSKYVGEVRGMGLMQAIEVVEDRKDKKPGQRIAQVIMEKTREYGLLIGKGGLYGNVLRISPPMLISETDIDLALNILEKAFAQL